MGAPAHLDPVSNDYSIRFAGPADIQAVYELGMEALEKDGYEGMRISPERVKAVAREVVTGAGNFCAVAEVDGRIVAAVSAIVHDQLFYERKQASVVQFYSRAPGCGIELLRFFMAWVGSRPGIKMVCFTLEAHADPRIGKLLRRLGLNQELPVYMRVK